MRDWLSGFGKLGICLWIGFGMLTGSADAQMPYQKLQAPPNVPTQKPSEEEFLVQVGTGFFVSNSGHVITNHHVIKGCKEVMLRGTIPDSMASIKAVDKENDLALLVTKARAKKIATIRHPGASQLKIGEPVMVMGYPLDSAMRREYQIAESTITGLKGIRDEPKWIQFSDAALQGNSGGPLLDASGNVAGVIVGKAYIKTAINGGASHITTNLADLAISLPILIRFLERNYIGFKVNASSTYMMTGRIEQFAKSYIVNVICRPET